MIKMILDKDFIVSKNVPGPTKEEVRCLVVCKSEVKPDDIVVDIGCGTGGLTLEFANKAKKVYAVDKNIEAINLTLKNLKKHNLEHKVEIIHNEGLNFLKEIDEIDILIIGGSGGNLTLIIEEGYKKLKKNGMIIITSILLETPVEAVKTMLKLKMVPDIMNVSVSKGKIIDRGTMMTANNPINIIIGKKND
jgi:cobalt-precorrin-6B (C15)-methyltransferase